VLHPPPLDLRDAAVARVSASSGVLFPPLSDELEGDGPACTSNSSPCCLYAFVVSSCCNVLFGMLQQMIFECFYFLCFMVDFAMLQYYCLRCCNT
jgi:hypothetical protein